MEARNTIKLFLFLSTMTTFGVSFVFATYVAFLRANNLNLLETNMVNFFFFATIFAFEIPTGAVADVFGRKVSVVISCFMHAIGLLLYSQATTFLGFAISEMIGAVAITFWSGAFESWMVDRLKHQGHEYELSSLLGRAAQLERCGAIIGAILGAWIADWNMKLPWMIAGCVQLAMGTAAWLMMKEENFVRKAGSLKEGWAAMKKTAETSVKFALKEEKIRFVLMTGVMMALGTQAPNMQWQPFFSQFIGDNTTPMGWLYGGMSMALIIGAGFASRWTKLWKSEKKAMVAAQVGTGLGLLLSAYLKSFPLTLTFFLFHEVMRGLFFPIKDAYTQENIPSSERATIISFESMIRQIGAMIGLVLSGVLAKYGSIPLTWVISGGILLFAAVWLVKNGKTLN